MWRVENKEGGVSGAKCCRGVIGLRPLADKGCAGECRAVWESAGSGWVNRRCGWPDAPGG